MTHKEIVALFARRDEAWRRRDAAALAADHALNAVAESPMQGRLEGRARIEKVYHEWIDAFPDFVFTSTELLIDGPRVAQFFTIAGTQAKAFGGVPPTGRKVQASGAWFYTIEDGHITYDRRLYDVTAVLVQMNVLRTKLVEPT